MKKTARAHTNIALIKYWGKANQALKTPLMSSLSMTLDAFYTDTTFEHDSSLTEDTFILNDQEQGPEESKRVFNYIHLLQEKFGFNDHFIIKSTNHVPTSAGLASSGSATRSIYGGFVEWQKGIDDASSYAIPIDENPDLDLSLLALEVDTKQKKISSTKGMKLAQTSPFYQPWLARNKQEIAELKQAIKEKDFTKIGKLSELSANEMHACNLTANEPFTYFEPETIKAIKLVEDLRKQGIECYYTIDAGPNVKILCTLRNRKEIISAVQKSLTNVKIVVASFGPGVTLL